MPEPSLDKSVLPSIIVIVECWAEAGKVEICLQLLSYPQCKSVREKKKRARKQISKKVGGRRARRHNCVLTYR